MGVIEILVAVFGAMPVILATLTIFTLWLISVAIFLVVVALTGLCVKIYYQITGDEFAVARMTLPKDAPLHEKAFMSLFWFVPWIDVLYKRKKQEEEEL